LFGACLGVTVITAAKPDVLFVAESTV